MCVGVGLEVAVWVVEKLGIVVVVVYVVVYEGELARGLALPLGLENALAIALGYKPDSGPVVASVLQFEAEAGVRGPSL